MSWLTFDLQMWAVAVVSGKATCARPSFLNHASWTRKEYPRDPLQGEGKRENEREETKKLKKSWKDCANSNNKRRLFSISTRNLQKKESARGGTK
jgi:hypothetical protein